jgi:hypothetical protein
MEGNERRRRARSFVLGGLVGASAAVAAARRRGRPRRRRNRQDELPAGLAAFEGAPCFEEALDGLEPEPD